MAPVGLSAGLGHLLRMLESLCLVSKIRNKMVRNLLVYSGPLNSLECWRDQFWNLEITEDNRKDERSVRCQLVRAVGGVIPLATEKPFAVALGLLGDDWNEKGATAYLLADNPVEVVSCV